MRVAATRKSGGGKLAVAVLRKRMNLFDQLADDALKDGEPVLFTRYSKLAIECAVSLAGYETPRLSAILTSATPQEKIINFELKIFERPRRPLAIESQQSQPGKTIDAEPVKEPPANVSAPRQSSQRTEAAASEPQPEPQPQPPSPTASQNGNASPEPNVYGTGSGRSLYEHWALSPSVRFGGGRAPRH
jgi:hypothetical protein